ELEARAAADLPQPGPARPDDDALVVLACDQDRRADDDDVALGVLGEALHLDRRAVRDLLLGLEEELFADRFLDEEALALRRVVLVGIEPRPLGQRRGHDVQEVGDVLTGAGADRYYVASGQER